MNPSRRFSRWSTFCLVLAAIAFARADLAYRNGALAGRTNLPYFEAITGLIPREPRPAGMWSAAPVTEIHLMLGLVAFALLAALVSVGLAIRARKHDEPPIAYAGVAVLSLGIALLSIRLGLWAWPSYLAL